MKSETMNLDIIRTFVKVGQAGSIKNAAANLKMDPSNVSRHIKALEEELNTKLIQSGVRGKVIFTDDGRKVLEEYEKAYNLLLLVEKELGQRKTVNSGKISIGCNRDLEISHLLPNIKKFKEKYPNIVIKVINSNTKELYEQLRKYAIDFAIIKKVKQNDKNSGFSGLQFQNLFSDKWCFVYNPKFYSNVNIEEESIIAPISTSPERELLNGYVNEKKIKINIKYEIQSGEHILEYVKEGLGVGFVSESLVKDVETLEKIELEDKDSLDINLVYIPETLSTAAKRFLELLK